MKNKKYILNAKDIIFALSKISYRIPTIISSVSQIKKYKDDEHNSWGKLIERNALQYKDQLALKFENSFYTYFELNEIINRYANYFSDQGITKGTIVNIFIDNRPELLFIYSAIAKIGAIASMINPNTKGDSLLHCINLHQSDYMIIGEEVWEAFIQIENQIRSKNIYYVSDKRILNTNLPDIRDIINSQATAYDSNPNIQLNDPIAYVFTSGTTGGLPKAAVITHKRLLSATTWFGKVIQETKPTDTIYCPLPFYHTNGLTVGWPTAIANGAALSFRRKFSVSDFWVDVRKFQANTFIYIGELPNYLMKSEEKVDDKNNPLTKMIGNGLRPEVWIKFKKRFGIKKVFEFYGAAESIWIFTNILNLNNTVGLNLQTYAVVEYDIEKDKPILDNGFYNKVSRDHVGLLLFKITDQYKFIGYTDEEATNKKIIRNVFDDGDAWFNTGDLVRDIGFKHVQFVDRLGDTFRYKGENVSTTEVEEILNKIPDIKSANVYGVQLPNVNGKVGMASLTSTNGEINLKDVYEYLSQNLPVYAIPKFIRMNSSDETTSTHKKIKYKLKIDGFNINKIKSPVYVMLQNKFQLLTDELYKGINDGNYRL